MVRRGICRSGLQSVASRCAALCVADNTPSCEIRREKPDERLRGRPHNGQVSESTEVNHFRDAQKAADMSKLYEWWSLRLWMGTILVSGGHYVGNPARVRRC